MVTEKHIDQARQRLLKAHHAYAYGVWEVISEHQGAECQLSGIKLGYFEGHYKDIVEFAVKHPRFYNYGRGGIVNKIYILSIADMQSQMQLLEEKEELERKLVEINTKLVAAYVN